MNLIYVGTQLQYGRSVNAIARGCRDSDRMKIGLTAICAIIDYLR